VRSMVSASSRSSSSRRASFSSPFTLSRPASVVWRAMASTWVRTGAMGAWACRAPAIRQRGRRMGRRIPYGERGFRGTKYPPAGGSQVQELLLGQELLLRLPVVGVVHAAVHRAHRGALGLIVEAGAF